ncbi:hypothetical protein FSP39_008800 [Pinctada imbricata]|uniref:glutaminase n=1 Tax=Pinctada imbricata TaxID=66713 RepID=A0AA88XU00_PINIB|nr:hypothetical protein FSP39_008800 [Pinctada imbricata]
MRNFQDVENSYNYDTFQDSLGSTFIDRNLFKECIQDNIILITKALKNSFIIPDFPSFRHNIDQIYWDLRANRTGQVATYIPQLARMNPEYWAVSICTVDGQRHSIGDVDVPFTLQSCSKPLTYALVQDEYNPEYVHKYIGREPSGRSFNEIKLDYQMKPHNPMINAGAILIASLVKPQMNSADRFDYVLKYLKRMAGGEYVSFSNPVFLSEKETADRNFALGYYMRENKCFPANVNLMDVMDFYFQLCSVEVTSDSTAVMAATLANGGYCPLTDEKVIDPASVRNTLSLMHSCGMYDWSGEFAFKELVNRFNFHHYDNLVHTPKKVDPTQQKMANRALDAVSLLFGAYNGDVTAMRRYHLLGMDMNLSDYDGRTALHLASSEGHEKVVSFLTEKCKVDPFLKDR